MKRFLVLLGTLGVIGCTGTPQPISCIGMSTQLTSTVAVTTAHEWQAVPRAKVLAISDRADLLFFQQDGAAPKQAPALPGSSVSAFGCGAQGQRLAASGPVILTRGLDRAAPGSMIVVRAPVRPGFSGGPVFDQSGQLIGITRAYFNESRDGVQAGDAFVVPIVTIMQEYQRLIVDREPGASVASTLIDSSFLHLMENGRRAH